MSRQWSPALAAALVFGVIGCAQRQRRGRSRPRLGEADESVARPPSIPPHVARPGRADGHGHRTRPGRRSELSGPQPVDAYIRRALAENRTVQAAFHNVQSLKHRIPQVTTLDDPVASNTIFPIPSVAPQYSLMGYNPYNLTLAQQFPWFGTLRLRGEVAEQDVQVALAELAAAQLDAVAAVKRAYFDLYASQKTEEILAENRKILEDFRDAREVAARDRRHPAGRAPGRGADQRARPGAGEHPAGDRHGPRRPRPAAPRQPRDRPRGPCPSCRWPPSRPRSSGSISWPSPPAPSSRAGWRPSPATRRPSSWPGSGSTRTSRSA